jgi:hypothetical protein
LFISLLFYSWGQFAVTAFAFRVSLWPCDGGSCAGSSGRLLVVSVSRFGRSSALVLLNRAGFTWIGDGDFVLFGFFVGLFDFLSFDGLSVEVALFVGLYLFKAEEPQFFFLNFVLYPIEFLFESEILFGSTGQQPIFLVEIIANLHS